LAITLALSACGSHGGRSPAYADGYRHGPEAFEAAPLVNNGVLARHAEVERACRTVANFYLVPDPDRAQWMPGCVAGATSFSR
jgi:hypothetical protein